MTSLRIGIACVALIVTLTSAADYEEPAVEVKIEGDCPCFYDGRVHHCNKSPWWDSKNDHRCVCGDKPTDWKTQDQCKQPDPKPDPTPDPKPSTDCPCFYGGRVHHCNKSPWWDSKNDHRCVCGDKATDWKTQEQCKQPTIELKAEEPAVEAKVEGNCPCFYGGRVHHCNKSPWWDSKNDHRCVCGDKPTDWKTQDQCKQPDPTPDPKPDPKPSTDCPCFYDGRVHHCNKSPWWDSKNDHRCVCGDKATDWKTQEQCKQPDDEILV